jgi:hypothetical protein
VVRSTIEAALEAEEFRRPGGVFGETFDRADFIDRRKAA